MTQRCGFFHLEKRFGDMTQDEFVRKHGPSGLNLRIALFWEKAPPFPMKKKLTLWVEEWLLDWDFSRPISAEVIQFYGCGTVKEYLSLSEREYVCENCGLVLDRDTNAAINILAEALFIELNLRFNTDVARRKFTPVEIVALACRLASMSETTVVDAHCTRISKECRSALVDNFFCCLWKNVDLSTVEDLMCIE